jgi:hypothetical protein
MIDPDDRVIMALHGKLRTGRADVRALGGSVARFGAVVFDLA